MWYFSTKNNMEFQHKEQYGPLTAFINLNKDTGQQEIP
jgi:hypothetical protein